MPTLETPDGCQLFYEDEGNGRPILLLHGAVSSARCFEEHISVLAEQGFRVVAPDLRGMGRSGRFTDIPPTTWTDDLLALVVGLGLQDVHLCGTSLGARIVLRFAIEHPDRVASVVADSPVLADSPRGAAAITSLFRDNLPEEFARQVRHWNGDDWRVVIDNFLMIRDRPGLQSHYDLINDLERVACPTLITRGDLDDDIHPLADSVAVHARLRASRLWIAPDTGFSAARFRSGDFLRHYVDFISQVPLIVDTAAQ
jgi:pimeloyl-ACP methyl ester carboxylesterase